MRGQGLHTARDQLWDHRQVHNFSDLQRPHPENGDKVISCVKLLINLIFYKCLVATQNYTPPEFMTVSHPCLRWVFMS